jgi:hypothetical protein
MPDMPASAGATMIDVLSAFARSLVMDEPDQLARFGFPIGFLSETTFD